MHKTKLSLALLHPLLVDTVQQCKAMGYTFRVSKGNRGYCYYAQKLITIPRHAIDHPDRGYLLYYIAHECAHALVGYGHHHDEVFMAKLIEICPPYCIHYETAYKPQAARSAGISAIPQPKDHLDDLLNTMSL